METQTLAKKSLVAFTRVYNAPRELVWKAWTEPERTKQWWGPRGFTAPQVEIDFREGGHYLYCMRSSDGKDYWSTGTFREIRAQERLVVTDSFADEKGNVVPASYYGMDPNWPLEAEVTVTFQDTDGKTRMRLTYSVLEGISDDDLKNMKQGWNETLDKLGKYLEEGA